MVGTKEARPFEIEIARSKGVRKCPDGRNRNAIAPPYMPEDLSKAFHPGGNSCCFAIQLAHLMGCDPLYLLGFTLVSGTRYFFGDKNPALSRASIYDSDRALHWLRWYAQVYPGRVKLVPGWDGPLQDIFETVQFDELPTRPETQSGSPTERDADEHSG